MNPSVLVAAGLPAGRLAFSPDGSLLAAATAGAVAMWDVAAGALLAVLPHAPADSAASHLTFSHDRPYLVRLQCFRINSQCATLNNSRAAGGAAARAGGGDALLLFARALSTWCSCMLVLGF